MILGMIDTTDTLRELYGPARGRSVQKQLARLDRHASRFIELSPFLVLASGADGRFDSSPRGGDPGFVKAPDDATLLIPDSPGNNRLDTLQNIVASGGLGILFLLPGVDETLRINGRARLVDDEATRALCADSRRTPKLVIQVAIEDVYLHCAKALMRSRLWSAESRVERSVLPTMGQMLNEQIGTPGPSETQEQMVERYKAEL
jgi:PPOX class probable FMN-dependent enzyme